MISLFEKCRRDNNNRLIYEYQTGLNGVSPNEIDAYTDEKVWWKCSICGFTWEAIPLSRFRKYKPCGCPSCVAKQHKLNRCISGINDLETWCKDNKREDLLQMVYNAGIDDPKIIAYQSEKKITLKCSICNTVFEQDPGHLTRKIKPSGCPNCNRGKQSSLNEIYICKILEELNIEYIHRYNKGTNKELDIFIPKYNVGIEWDGEYYHGINLELSDKAKYYTNLRILRFIEVREQYNTGIVETANERIVSVYTNTNSYKDTIYNEIFNILNIEKDSSIITNDTAYKKAIVSKYNVGMTDCLGELFKDYKTYEFEELNNISPFNIKKNSHIRVLLKCPRCNKVFEQIVSKLANKLEKDIKNLHYNCECDSIGYIFPELARLVTSGEDIFQIKTGSNKSIEITCPNCGNTQDLVPNWFMSNNIKKGFNLSCKCCNKILININNKGLGGE